MMTPWQGSKLVPIWAAIYKVVSDCECLGGCSSTEFNDYYAGNVNESSKTAMSISLGVSVSKGTCTCSVNDMQGARTQNEK